MTRNEFIQEFAAIAQKYDFRVRGNDHWIRGRFGHDCLCPLTAVCFEKTGELLNTHCFDTAAEMLSVNCDDTDAIVGGADDDRESEDAQGVRELLIAAINGVAQ